MFLSLEDWKQEASCEQKAQNDHGRMPLHHPPLVYSQLFMRIFLSRIIPALYLLLLLAQLDLNVIHVEATSATIGV